MSEDDRNQNFSQRFRLQKNNVRPQRAKQKRIAAVGGFGSNALQLDGGISHFQSALQLVIESNALALALRSYAG